MTNLKISYGLLVGDVLPWFKQPRDPACMVFTVLGWERCKPPVSAWFQAEHGGSFEDDYVEVQMVSASFYSIEQALKERARHLPRTIRDNGLGVLCCPITLPIDGKFMLGLWYDSRGKELGGCPQDILAKLPSQIDVSGSFY